MLTPNIDSPGGQVKRYLSYNISRFKGTSYSAYLLSAYASGSFEYG